MKFLFMIGLLLFLSCQRGNERTTEEMRGEEEVRKVRLVETTKGRKIFELEAGKITQRGDTTWIYGLHAKFYDREGRVSSNLEADSGFYLRKYGDMKAFGDVKFSSQEGKKLFTSFLAWEKRKNRIWTDKKVKILSNGKEIIGEGLESDPQLREIIIKGKVEGIRR